jgi:hypothetical protein
VNPNEPKRTIEEWLEAIDRKLDYVIALLRSDDEEESKTITFGKEMQEFEERDALETEKAFARWSENEKAKGRPE